MGVVRRGTRTSNIVEWIFATLVIAVGIANLILVDPVPALGYAIVSLVYLPPANALLKQSFGVSIHPVAKVALGVATVMFTLGVSDFGDMID